MTILNRRNFLINVLKGTSVTLLGLIPGSVFHRSKLFAQAEEEFETIFNRTTRTNVYQLAMASSLSSEEKMALVAARELSRSDIKKAIANISLMGGRVEDGGGCGSGCGGQYCGDDCAGEGGQQSGICVIDKQGRMNISMASLDKNKFKRALEKALNVVR